MSKLIFGCGYLGERVGRLWLDEGEVVHAATRSAERAERLSQEGFEPLVADVTRPDSWSQLPEVDTLLYAVGYDRQAGPAIEEVYVEGLRNVLDRLTSPARIVYISTTGVYGPGEAGAWVDERSPCEPARPGGKASLAAERLLAAHPNGKNHVILRMAGLYGPGRLPLSAQLQAGEAIPAEPDAYLNLIHIDDAAQITVLAAAATQPAACYCVSDGEPVLRRDFYSQLARLLEAPAPGFAPPNVNSATGETVPRRGSGDKRISNARLLADLPVALQFPSYREGLAAICGAR